MTKFLNQFVSSFVPPLVNPICHTWRDHKLCPERSSGSLISEWSAATSRWPRNLRTLFWIWGKKSSVARGRDFECWPDEPALLGTRLGDWLFDNLNMLGQQPHRAVSLKILPWDLKISTQAVTTSAIQKRPHPSTEQSQPPSTSITINNFYLTFIYKNSKKAIIKANRYMYNTKLFM